MRNLALEMLGMFVVCAVATVIVCLATDARAAETKVNQLGDAAGSVGIGDAAPDFTLPAYPRGDFTLSDHRGETVVLYFYPGDDTPVCTRQALAFKDMMDDFQNANAAIVGISQDSWESHRDFARKYSLPFPLLVDAGGDVRTLYGMPDGGEELQGRITYIIDKEGVVRHIIFEEEDMGGHVAEALEWAQRLAEPAARTMEMGR